MNQPIDTRETGSEDLPALERLYRHTFPDEDLLPLVRDLLAGDQDVLSLAAIEGAAIVGHVAFTRCMIGADGLRAALLGPLAVAPDHQRQGIARAIVAAGHDRLAREGIGHVFVLGDPAFYSRLGFTREDAVNPPYALPDEWDGAWQSLGLLDGPPPPAGDLTLPAVWMRPELWGP